MGDKIINKEEKLAHKREIDRKYYQKKKQERLNKKGEYKPEFFKNLFKFLEDRKQNKSNDVNVINKIKTKAETLDESFHLDEINMINRHQDKVQDFEKEIKLILEEADAKKLEPVKEVYCFSFEAKAEIVKKIKESQNKWIEQIMTKFPEIKTTLIFYKDVMIRNEFGRFEVIKAEKE